MDGRGGLIGYQDGEAQGLVSQIDYWKREAEQFRRLLESKQEELAREQKLREDREKAHNIERIQWREALREEKETSERWRRLAEKRY
jgi:hypothetical protein